MHDAKAFSRVHDEAAFQYSLRMHPNVVTVHGILRDEEAGVLGIVMERCSCALSDVLYGSQKGRAGSFGLATKLDIMLQVRGCGIVGLRFLYMHVGTRAGHVRAVCATLTLPSTHPRGPQGESLTQVACISFRSLSKLTQAANILIVGQLGTPGSVKIADFGFARVAQVRGAKFRRCCSPRATPCSGAGYGGWYRSCGVKPGSAGHTSLAGTGALWWPPHCRDTRHPL